MNPGMKLIKYLLFLFNLIFSVTGVALIVTGAVVQSFYSQYLDFLGNELLSASMLFIIVGIIIFFVTFFGCCGASKENSCMILTFACLLGIILVCGLAGGIAAYVLRSDVGTIVEMNMRKSMDVYSLSGHEGVTKTWDGLQHEFRCCGVAGFNDWGSIDVMNKVNVPDSCCKTITQHCGENMITAPRPNDTIFTDGCAVKLQESIQSNAGIIAGVGIGVAVIQVKNLNLTAIDIKHALYPL
ncbi:hypothetical protein QYM36_002315 [Artemia franciscana]|uniref:Tetraspanin n=1 Tax=Artemia franciscana TaxID=6661 RepID=A0AA88LEU5_ARTSF|nr:hypothetical protein QYM36_002315 [Artemia franciscana]